jgi:hypothetical protein
LRPIFRPKKPAAPGRKFDAAKAQGGRQLAERFNCVQCHGPQLAGQQHIPRLAGQQLDYLRTQLRGFKASTRFDMDGQMTPRRNRCPMQTSKHLRITLRVCSSDDLERRTMKPHLARYVLASCAAGVLAIDSHAQQGLKPPPSAVLLPEVVTSATRSERDSFDLPVAIDSVDKAAIQEDRPQVNLSEALNRVPGISALNRQNYAQDLQDLIARIRRSFNLRRARHPAHCGRHSGNHA